MIQDPLLMRLVKPLESPITLLHNFFLFYLSVVGWNPVKGSSCFLEQDTLTSLLSIMVGPRNRFKQRDFTI